MLFRSCRWYSGVQNLDCCASNLRAGSPEVHVVCHLANENDTQAFFAKFDFNVKVAFISSCFHSKSLTQVT